MLYEGDKPNEVIEEFGNEHSLNDKKRAKLLDVINAQLSLITPQEEIKQSKLDEIKEKPNEETE